MIKFKIVIVLLLFMISAVSASENNEIVDIDNSEILIEEFIEVNDLDFNEFENDDIVENDVIGEDEITPNCYNQEYNHSYLINEPENYYEIENFQYDNYIESLINETLNYDSVLDLNNSHFPPISNYFFNDEMFYINFNSNNIDFSFLSTFKGIDKLILAHEDFIFYNDYCYILTHDVDKNIILSNDKLNTKFAFSINNSIMASGNCFLINFLNSNSFNCLQTFSNFVLIFVNIN